MKRAGTVLETFRLTPPVAIQLTLKLGLGRGRDKQRG
jgi:hypothetical protein